MKEWLDHISVKYPDSLWYIKILSINDVQANQSHQAGPYLSKGLIRRLVDYYPEIRRTDVVNPRVEFISHIESHESSSRTVKIIYYNNAFRGGTRNEYRVTGFGGTSSPFLNPDNAGSVVIMIFTKCGRLFSWITQSVIEHEFLEELLFPIEPGIHYVYVPDEGLIEDNISERELPCRVKEAEIPEDWYMKFPSPKDVINLTAQKLAAHQEPNLDELLLHRRNCEYSIYRDIERIVEYPKIKDGFGDIESFLKLANSILQRRKSRSGLSLELHMFKILCENGFSPDFSFSYQATTEGKRRPDFIFPSIASYKDMNFPVNRIRLLACKTTCKDRWRQVVNESSRLQDLPKHLLTLQEGLSENQFDEMSEYNIVLVVPKPLHEKYPVSIRDKLISLSEFIDQAKTT